MIERFNLTLKTELLRIFASRNSHRLSDDLSKIFHAYNLSINQVTGIKQANVTKENAIIR